MEETTTTIDWLTPSIGIIGVVIGALLSPIVTSLIEKIKHKRTIKPDLIKNVYIFFNLRKVIIEMSNSNGLQNRIGSFLWADLRKADLSPVHRSELERQYNVRNEAMKINSENLNHYFRMIIEVESQIHYLLSQVDIYWEKKDFIQVSNLIKPHLDKSNSPTRLKDYDKMNKDEIESYQKIFKDELSQKSKQMNTECDNLITNVLDSI